MKLGLISDIHGDEQRLKQALHVLLNRGVDRILCAGDVVYFLKHADPVIKLLLSHQIPCVRGNHERWYLEYHEENPKKNKTFPFLAGLPLTIPFDLEGVRVLLAHGAPWDDMQVVYPNNLSLLGAQFDACCGEYQVVILGHTHIPMCVRWKDLLIINPGSICKLYSHDSETCGILTLPSCKFEVFRIQNGETVELPG